MTTAPAKPKTLVPVMLACNDPDNGRFVGIVDMIEVGDEFLELEGHARLTVNPSVRGVVRADMVRLGRYRYRYRSYIKWYGNWCWDRIEMEAEEAAKLLNNLRRSGNWSPVMGASFAWEMWENGDLFTAADFEPGAHGVEDEA